MVNVKFVQRVEHPVTLANIKALAAGTTSIPYLSKEGLGAIKKMQLINRGRLSRCSSCRADAGVQPVDEAAYDAIIQLGEKGGWKPDKPLAEPTKRKAEDGPVRRSKRRG